MTQDELKIGARVICRFAQWSGIIGTVSCIHSYNIYSVIDDDGVFVGGSKWADLRSWDIYYEIQKPESIPESIPEPTPEPTTVQSAIQDIADKPICQYHYNGCGPCSCNKSITQSYYKFQ